MYLNVVEKIEEGRYLVASLPCPSCSDVFMTTLPARKLWEYNQGAHVQDVLPNHSADDRERFITGFCTDCWNKLFGSEE